MMRPHVPNCENRKPYCVRGGEPMKCVGETEHGFTFVCTSCGQTNIITRPEFRAKMRQQATEQRNRDFARAISSNGRRYF